MDDVIANIDELNDGVNRELGPELVVYSAARRTRDCSAGENVVDHVDSVGDIGLVGAVDIAALRILRRLSSGKNVIDEIDGVGDIDLPGGVQISARNCAKIQIQ